MRALRYRDLRREKVPLSKPHIDRLEAAGKFPKRIQLGPRSVAWLESEIDDWLAARAKNRDLPPEAA